MGSHAHDPVSYLLASSCAAVVNYPLWKASAIAQSGFKAAPDAPSPHSASSVGRLGRYLAPLRPPYKGMVPVITGMAWARAAMYVFVSRVSRSLSSPLLATLLACCARCVVGVSLSLHFWLSISLSFARSIDFDFFLVVVGEVCAKDTTTWRFPASDTPDCSLARLVGTISRRPTPLPPPASFHFPPKHNTIYRTWSTNSQTHASNARRRRRRCLVRPFFVLCISFHPVPFRSIPFHSVPFCGGIIKKNSPQIRSVPFRSIPFRPIRLIRFVSFYGSDRGKAALRASGVGDVVATIAPPLVVSSCVQVVHARRARRRAAFGSARGGVLTTMPYRLVVRARPRVCRS